LITKLENLLEINLDFAGKSMNSGMHNFHSFPAKFPPDLPKLFINELTKPGDIVLDPMCGSGTTIVEALLSQRKAIGFDIDPLAAIIANVKSKHLNPTYLYDILELLLDHAQVAIESNKNDLERVLANKWDVETKEFIDFWFSKTTQIELIALLSEIENLPIPELINFFKLIFSSIIITKSGGVSNALDLAHTRPHKAKNIIYKTTPTQNLHLFHESKSGYTSTKVVKSALIEFRKKTIINIQSLSDISISADLPIISIADTRQLPLPSEYVDLIITSPPYASNAIDYMRAHKFSLVWFGYPISILSKKRKEYIGSDSIGHNQNTYIFPKKISNIIKTISSTDSRKGLSISKYYFESAQILNELFRVLKPGKTLIYVVGSSIVRGIDIDIGSCLQELGESIGFTIPKIGVRSINRDHRMLPTSRIRNQTSLIEQRIHNEFVIGFYKPE
jgi:DNA modification methylase